MPLLGFPCAVWALMAVEFAERLGYYAVSFSLFTYCTNMLRAGPAVTNALLNGLYVVIPLAACVASGLADGRVGRPRTLRAALVTYTSGLALLTLSSSPLMYDAFPYAPTAASVTLFACALVTFSVGYGAMKVCTNPMMADGVTAHVREQHGLRDNDDNNSSNSEDDNDDDGAKSDEAGDDTRTRHVAAAVQGEEAASTPTPLASHMRDDMDRDATAAAATAAAEAACALALSRLFRCIYWVTNAGALVGIAVAPLLRSLDGRDVRVGDAHYAAGYYCSFAMATCSVAAGLVAMLYNYAQFVRNAPAPSFVLVRLIARAVYARWCQRTWRWSSSSASLGQRRVVIDGDESGGRAVASDVLCITHNDDDDGDDDNDNSNNKKAHALRDNSSYGYGTAQTRRAASLRPAQQQQQQHDDNDDMHNSASGNRDRHALREGDDDNSSSNSKDMDNDAVVVVTAAAMTTSAHSCTATPPPPQTPSQAHASSAPHSTPLRRSCWRRRRCHRYDVDDVNARGWTDDCRTALRMCRAFVALPVYWLVCNQFSSNLMYVAAAVDLPDGAPQEVFNNVNTLSLLAFLLVYDRVLMWRHKRQQQQQHAMNNSNNSNGEGTAAASSTATVVAVVQPPAARTRIAVGFALMCTSMLWCAAVQSAILRRGSYHADDDDAYVLFDTTSRRVSWAWLLLPYALQGVASALVDTTVMEVAYVGAPAHLKGTVMALYWLASSASGLLGVIFSPVMRPQNALLLFLVFAAVLALVTALFVHLNDASCRGSRRHRRR